MKRIKLLLIIIACSSSLSTFSMSAQRKPGETFIEAARRHTSSHKLEDFAKDSALLVASEYEKLDYSKIPKVDSMDKLVDAFTYLRDLRFIKNMDEKIDRRLSWFYPDNGCWTKAELMKDNLKKYNKQKLGKVFIFGDLKVKTHFSPAGEVTWWYHVVPALNLNGEIYLIDPTLDRMGPLKLKDWALLQVDDLKEAKFSFCHPNTYTPNSRCESRLEEIRLLVESTQKDFLSLEVKRLKELNLDQETYLGDSPPW